MADTLSFSDIRAKHAECLRLCNQAATSPELIADIRKFVEDVRLAGRDIVDDDDREYLRSLLTFWGNWIYNQTRTYPNTNIEPFTAEAAAMHGREAAEKIVKGRPVSEGQRNRLIIGGVILLGLIGVIAVVALVVGVLPLMFRVNLPPTETASVAIQLTVEAIHVQNTEIASGMETLSAPTDTPLPTETAVVVNTPISVEPSPPPIGITATSTRPAVPSAPPSPPGPPTPTPSQLPATGGGGFAPPPVGIISVQIIEPQNAAEARAGDAINIGGTYFNLQAGWRMFYVVTRFDTAESVIVPSSVEATEDGATGAWTTRTVIDIPGLYSISVFIATSRESAAQLQRWADAGKLIPPETQYDGVILFRDLTVFEVR